MVQRENTIEIAIRVNKRKIVKVGAAPVCELGEKDSCDKDYFCNAGEPEKIKTIEEFRERLETYSTEGVLEVFLVDGLPIAEKKKNTIHRSGQEEKRKRVSGT